EVAFVLTDEGEYVTEVKRDYHLYQNYPNPFNPNTVISYQLAVNSYVKVMVYDIKGELLEVLVNENKPAGYYEVEFNAGKYASGIYLYRIEAVDESGIPRFMDMKKMMLVK
ncbi:MAG: T9SS type A sorting domain-containing protein, partial [Ignavibacteriaceae bacterium]|nr:T9SS type A sorting domain-containing protein [Ignavibacteriaceae bacterium]